MAGKQGQKPDRTPGKEQASKRTARNSNKADQETLNQTPQPRRVPGLNGYDPKLWPDVCR